MTTIHYSDGRSIQSVIIIEEDRHAERAGLFRAFWAESPDARFMSPVIGYCSPGGSHRTVRGAAIEARRLYPHDPIYRNGRLLNIGGMSVAPASSLSSRPTPEVV